MDLKNIFELWNLDSVEKIASTHTSDIYKVKESDLQLVVKFLNTNGQNYEKNGYIGLEAFAGNGSVQLINKTNNALLLEWVDGEKLSTLVKQGYDSEANKIICDVLKKLHKAKIPNHIELPNLERQFKSLLERGRDESKDSIYYKTLKITEYLLETEDEKCLLHGDVHHDNLLNSSSRGWLSIDPHPLIGERLYDFANCFFNPEYCPKTVEVIERIENMAKTFAMESETNPTRILMYAFAHGGLSMSWQLDDGVNPERRLRITKLLEKVLKI
jgi:streptomycin 6-kinase